VRETASRDCLAARSFLALHIALHEVIVSLQDCRISPPFSCINKALFTRLFGFPHSIHLYSFSFSKPLLPRSAATSMSQSGQGWLSSLRAYIRPQPNARSTIQSARDWLSLPPASLQLLNMLRILDEDSIAVSLPFRIVTAWHCEEANGEDIVYVEAIIPLTENIPKNIRIVEKKLSEEGEEGEKGTYRLERLLVCRKEYKKLLVLQKKLFGLS
jgi:hypothetical protein